MTAEDLPEPPIGHNGTFDQNFQSYLEHAYYGQVDKLPKNMRGQLRAAFMAGCVVSLGRTLDAITAHPTPTGAEFAIRMIKDEIEVYAEKAKKGEL